MLNSRMAILIFCVVFCHSGCVYHFLGLVQCLFFGFFCAEGREGERERGRERKG